jgi:hypothetical protein
MIPKKNAFVPRCYCWCLPRTRDVISSSQPLLTHNAALVLLPHPHQHRTLCESNVFYTLSRLYA